MVSLFPRDRCCGHCRICSCAKFCKIHEGNKCIQNFGLQSYEERLLKPGEHERIRLTTFCGFFNGLLLYMEWLFQSAVSLLTYHCVGNQNFDTKENTLTVNSCLWLIKKKLPLYHLGRKTKNKISVVVKKHMNKESYCRKWTALTVTVIA